MYAGFLVSDSRNAEIPVPAARANARSGHSSQEAKAASALDHPNICTIHEINETDDGQLYLVMAHYEGETLKERIARHRDLPMSLGSFLVSSGSSCHRAVRTRAAAVMVLLLALLPSGLLAQPPPQRPTFRAGIDLIEIDVTVVNGQGVPVKDLRAPEFTVSVDGQPRSVVTAEFIDLRAETPEGRPASADAGEGFYSSNTAATRGRLIVLMIDRENMTFGAGSNVTRAAARFVEKLTSNDRVALVTLPRPGPLVDFTANHDLVRDAVDGLVGLGQPPLGLLNIGMQEAFTFVNAGAGSHAAVMLMERLCGHLRPASLDREVCEDRVERDARRMVQEQRMLTDDSLSSSSRPPLPGGGSHRTVQVLFTYGSSGQRISSRGVSTAAGRFSTSPYPRPSVSWAGATICRYRHCSASDTSPRSAKYALRSPRSTAGSWLRAHRDSRP